MVVVADTSPVAALIHLNKLHLISMLYGKVYIPATVAVELNTLVQFGYDISFLEEKQTYIVQKAANELLVRNLCEYLDEGEAEAIALAKELHADLLLIDERLGKQFAEAEAIHCKGVIGILIEAKQQKLVQFIKPLLDDLIHDLKFRLSEKVYIAALKKAGELV